MTSAPLFTCFRQTAPDQREELCSLKTDHVTAFVLAILGVCMLCTGVFLMFGPIGTIPASMGGLSLILAGIAGITSAIIITVKANN